MKRNALGALAGVLMCAAFLVGGGSAAVVGKTCTLTPTLRDITINQGLQTYSVLARGKEALVRLYLSLPSCAVSGNSVQISKVTLTVSLKNAATSAAVGQPQTITDPTPSLGSPLPQITNLFSNPPLTQMAPSDPVFIVPGSVLAPPGDTNRLVATFSASIDWQSVPAGQSGTATALTSTTAGTAMTKTVEKQTRALRLLVVPMGGLLDSAGTAAIENGMTALSRLYPVPDGTGGSGIRVGGLTSTDGGIRYGINNAYLDLNALKIPFAPPTTPFCGNATSFGNAGAGLIDTQLSQFRQSWNSANPGYPVDNVVGAIGESQSTGSATSAACDEARAAVNGREAWVRATSDTTGALLAMELEHNYGYVPVSRGDANFHSLYGHADHSVGDAYRGYNVSARQYLPDNRSNMRFTPPGWTGQTALLEPPDWADVLCVLGGATNNECANAGTAGTVAGTAAGLTDPVPVASFVMSGTTDGTPTGTHVLESYVAATVPTPLVSSSYRLFQLDAAGTSVQDPVPVPVSFDVSNHNAAEPPTASPVGLFSFAVPVNPSAKRIELRNGDGVVLYSAKQQATVPTIGQPIVVRALSARRAHRRLAAAGVTAVASDATGAGQIANAIAADPSVVTGASFDSVPPSGTPNGVASSPFNGFPTDGTTFGILTTGDVNLANTANTSTSSSADDGGSTPSGRGNTAYDVTTLKLDLAVPATANCLTFNFRYLSEEYPEYIGTTYNDAFVAELDTSNWTTSGSTITAPNNFAFDPSGNVVSINSSGNTSMSSANAIDTTYDGGTPLLSASKTVTPGAHTLYLSIFDQSDRVYDSAVFLDRLVLGHVDDTTSQCVAGAKPVHAISYTVNVDPATPADQVRSDLLLKCPNSGTYTIVRVGLIGPTVSVPQTVGCPGGGGEFDARAYDGFSASPIQKVQDATLPSPPTPAFAPAATSPSPGQTYSVNDDISLVGSAFDYATGTTAKLQWLLDWQPIAGATGQQADVRASTLGVVGAHTITLQATAGSKVATVDIPITISADADGDGIPASLEQVIHDCAVSKNIKTDGGDSDPTNGTKDYDGDGIPNREDPLPCTPALSYPAAAAIFLPNPLSLSATGSLSAGGMYVPFRDMTQLVPKNNSLPSVFIKEIGLGEGTPIPVNEQASGYIATGPLGAASFARAPLIAALNANHIVNRSITLTITGTATDPVSGPWTFTAVVSTYVTN